MKPAACALCVLLSLPAFAELHLAEYRGRLQSIERKLDQGDRAGAAREAASLLHEKIEWQGETLRPDAPVLEPISAEEEGVLLPLRSLIAALANVPAGSRAAAPDAVALDRLKKRQEAEVLKEGGALPGAPIKKLSFTEQFVEWIKTSAEWIHDRLRDLWHWLKKWWPDPAASAGGGNSSTVLNPVVFAVVGAILVLVIALAVRAARKPAPALPERPRAAARDADEDPLSRAANEWETRARELSAEGRFREAIRAWYHALLVASFRAGLLHHRRGRTNWEYARALGDAPWRGRFFELTSRFDLEWYGRAESTREAADFFAAEAQALLGELPRRAA